MSNPIIEIDKGLFFEGQVFQNRPFELGEFDSNLPLTEHVEKYSDRQGFPIMVNEDRIMYLPNKWESLSYFQDMIENRIYRKRLENMKGLLIDDSFPDHLVFRVIEDEYTVYSIEDFGRHWLVWLAGEIALQQSLQELREVMLYDTSYEMREQAIESISKLKGKSVSSALSDKLMDVEESMSLRELVANKLYDHPSQDNVENLIDVYEETSYNPPKSGFYGSGFAIHQGRWMPNHCLRALGRIPTLDAFRGIELGLKHPLEKVNHWSRVALDDWINVNAEIIFNRSYNGDSQKRIDFMKKLILKYGIETQRDFYDNARVVI